jgi:hypothetical protein
MAVVAGRGSGAGRSLADRPGPRLLAAIGSAIAATTLACAVVLVVRRMQVPFDTSANASVAAVVVGILLVAVVDVASFGVGPAARTLQRLAVRLGLALALAATLPGPAALQASPSHPLPLVATVGAVAAAVLTLVAPSLGWFPGGSSPHRHVGLRDRDRSTDATSDQGRRRRKQALHQMRSETPPPIQIPIPEAPPRGPKPPGDAVSAPAHGSAAVVPGILQQRFERYVLPDERMECIRGTLHLAVVSGSRLVTGHVGFCPPFHHLPMIEVGTACEEVEATIVAAEVLPWGARIECRLDEPADETILIPVDVYARAPLPAIDAPPASPLR